MSKIQLKTSHDVRHLKICTDCGQVGDDRQMLRLQARGGDKLFHGSCAVKGFTFEGLLQLPISEIGKLTLADTGVELMKRIIKAQSKG